MEDAKALVIYWHGKGYPATKMYVKLLARGDDACPAYSTITKWIRALIRGEDIRGHASGGGRLADDRVDALIAAALEESPFHSVRSLASAIKIPPTTVWRHLHSSGFVVRNLRIVPHTLSAAQKAARVESAIELKKVLCRAKHDGWRYFLTGDESWFYFDNYPDHAWVAEGATAPIRPRQTIASPKRMLTVFWSPLGFSLVQILPKGEHFNARYFCENIIAEIDRIRPASTAEDARRKIVLHFDNASPHTAAVSLDFLRSNRMRRAPQAPFSPDLAPSDFYLFGKLKTALMGSEFEDEQGLLGGVMAVLNGITSDELESVFEGWVRRLDACVERGGDYVE
jgi:histone-lysine N-methyltransferase SETMAR